MTFDEVLAQVREVLEREGRVSYRALKRRFNLDDDYLEDLKEELIKAKQWARDEDGAVLVWTGSVAPTAAGGAEPTQFSAPSESLTDPSAARQPPALDPPTLSATRPEAERRQLTVMFCDLVGSTTLSAQLDPEELHGVLHAYQEVCAGTIRRLEGYIAQYLGDGVLMYFGYPAAHEDDAARAVRAGLEIIDALYHLNAHLPRPVQVRIGVHTGPVLVTGIGSGERQEQLALGETPNIAAWVQGHAAPDRVAISAATYRLVQGLFDCQLLGEHALKGITTPLALYQVQGVSEVQSRFEAAVRTGLTPLVGREEELGLLRQRWAQAKEGAGHVVLLSGEAGIGKSRLVQALKEHIIAEGATRIEFRCSPYHQNSAFYPIIDHLQRLLQFAPHETPHVKLTKLQQTLTDYRFPQADTVPLLASLLSLPHPEGAPPLTLSPQRQKQKTQEVLMAWLHEEAQRAAVYNGWKDLHWADPSTLEVLTLLLDQVPTTRLLVLLTFRPEFTPPWGLRSYFTPLILSRLGRQHVETMVERFTGGKALPAEVLQHIVTKTDGVPLFVEELTKTVLESGLLKERKKHYELTGPLPPLAIPSTLQDSLMARLDRLAPVREIAQLGATLGREFSYELIHAISPLDEGTLQQRLRQLIDAELLYQRGLPPQATYVFKHVLVQDTAYQSLLKSKRQQLHQQIVQALTQCFPETVETQPELVAHHYTEAGLTAQAIPHWQQAGQRAIARSANVEAISHLTKGLELLKTLPDTPERTQQELTLQIALGVPLMATAGYAAPGVENAYARARQLCQQLGESPQLFPALRGLWVFYLLRAELQTTYELGEQLLTLAQRVQEPALLVEAHYALGAALFFRGEPARARTHLEQCMTLYDPQRHGSHAFLYGQDPGVFAHIVAALALWVLGYGDQALKRIHDGLLLAQQLSHQFSLAGALLFVAWLYHFRREGQESQDWAEAGLTLSREQGFPFWMGWGTILRGWALAEQGQGEEGIAQMRQGLSGLQATGAELVRPYIFAKLAEAYGEVGQPEEGLTLLAEALAVAYNTGERWGEAELYRLKGTLLLQPKAQRPRAKVEEEAEECFLKAISIARQQGAKSLELRAVMSLSRLWQQQGKKAEAHQQLAEIYGWFTEGFDTKDLQEAKALLQELA
jgi:class 3 adenylate cyclase/predicted ATPase